MAKKTHDLGVSAPDALSIPMVSEATKKGSKPKKHYPSVYISGVEGLDLAHGDEVSMTGKVTSVTISSKGGTKTASYDIQIDSLDSEAGEEEKEGGLGSALDKIASKKAEVEPDSEDTSEEDVAEGE